MDPSKPAPIEVDAPSFPVANVVYQRRTGHGGLIIHPGTKQFRGGAKVVIIGDYPGMTETVIVVWLTRRGRYITIATRVWWLDNLRAKQIFRPAVLRRIADAGAPSIDDRGVFISIGRGAKRGLTKGGFEPATVLRRRVAVRPTIHNAYHRSTPFWSTPCAASSLFLSSSSPVKPPQ